MKVTKHTTIRKEIQAVNPCPQCLLFHLETGSCQPFTKINPIHIERQLFLICYRGLQNELVVACTLTVFSVMSLPALGWWSPLKNAPDESTFFYWKPWWVSRYPQGESSLLESKGQLRSPLPLIEWAGTQSWYPWGQLPRKCFPD